MNDAINTDQASGITRYVDIQAPPPNVPTALFLFGTNQAVPAVIAAERYHEGLAPIIIATGGVNRHNGIVEGQEFKRQLQACGVPPSAIRVEDTSANTWQNVENAIPYLIEAIESGLCITAVSKWFHRRTVHILRTLVPHIPPFYALGWEPVYEGTSVTRTNWMSIPDGERRVIREWREVSRRVADGTLEQANVVDGAWQ